MRRLLSIFLILFFWLGPLTAILPASEDARLPACCRRHGAHHCMLSMQMAADGALAASTSIPIFTAPATCPYFPDFTAVPTADMHALAAAPISLPVLLAQPHSPAAGHAAARISQVRTRTSRGPPATTLA